MSHFEKILCDPVFKFFKMIETLRYKDAKKEIFEFLSIEWSSMSSHLLCDLCVSVVFCKVFK